VAHRFERPLAAEMNESEQSPGASRANVLAAGSNGFRRLARAQLALAWDDRCRSYVKRLSLFAVIWARVVGSAGVR
jgi:hypothetical protein